MKRCKVCQKRTDNGTKFCPKCGTAFEYDPKVTPFSETKIFLGILMIALVSFVIYKSIPLKLPDPTECSRTSVNRFKRIAEDYYKESKNALRQEVIISSDLSKLRVSKNEAEDIPVPPCLEPAKSDLVNYLDQVYYIGVYSVWGYYQGAAASTQKAGVYWDAFNSRIAEVKDCLPNCP